MKKRESGLQSWAVQYLNNIEGCKALPLQPGLNGIETGTPDIIGSFKGKTFLIELKRDEYNAPKPIQIHRMMQWRTAGAITGCCYTRDMIREFVQVWFK